MKMKVIVVAVQMKVRPVVPGWVLVWVQMERSLKMV